ncbi:3-dehydroquinate synthase [Candidatus Saganbacteria bacterium]|nr:3-dehydroquinate synthase [Candidatus Saganbacteria bacterium]
MQKVKVSLKERSYDVLVGSGALYKLAGLIKNIKSSSILLITDTNVDSLYGSIIREILKQYQTTIIKVPAGEKHKTLYTAAAVYDQMVVSNIHRDSLLIAFGGGVVCDLAGFVAATYMRGLPLVNVPTTLLAQVDASIGGKTGVDHEKGKNLIGAFYQPKLVVIDPELIKTLPPREIKTGLAEVVKYGIIKDASIFRLLERNPVVDPKFWETIIAKCAKIKADVVSRDEYERTGLRMILNLGHTFGHAIESLTSYSKYTHGEAVSAGIAASAHLARRLKLLSKIDLNRITSLLSKFKLPVVCKLRADLIIGKLALDKKVMDGKVVLVLPNGIGKTAVRNNIPAGKIKLALKEIGCR